MDRQEAEAIRCGSCGLQMAVLSEEKPCSQCGILLCIGCNEGDIHRARESGKGFSKAVAPCLTDDPFYAIHNAFDVSPIGDAIERARSWAEGIETVVRAQKDMLDAFRAQHDCDRSGHVWEEDVESCGGRCCACKANYEELEAKGEL